MFLAVVNSVELNIEYKSSIILAVSLLTNGVVCVEKHIVVFLGCEKKC